MATGRRGSLSLGASCSCAAGLLQLFTGSCKGEFWRKGGHRRLLVNAPERRVSDLYTVGKVLGRGGFGIASRATERRTGKECVLKAVDRIAVPDSAALEVEVAIHASLDHPNIVRVYESFKDHVHLFIVMELCQGGDLCEVMERRGACSEADSRLVLGQIIHAVNYMHCKGVAHRDLKLENFLVKDRAVPLARNTVKMIDFGFAVKFTPGKRSMKTVCGTPDYMAPEIIEGPYDEKCDVWSCGVLLHCLLCNELPFQGSDYRAIQRAARHRRLRFAEPEWEAVSGGAKFLINRMCEKTPDKRWSAREVLQSQWFDDAPSEEVCASAARKMMDNVERFVGMCPFRQACMDRVAYNLDDSIIAPFRTAFKLLDADGDGRLTKEELREGLRRGALAVQERFGEAMSPERVQCVLDKLMGAANTTSETTLEYTEFITAFMDHDDSLPEQACWAAFRSIDADGSGAISVAELRRVLVLECMGQHRAKATLEEADMNGDGEIDFEEFLRLLGPRAGPGRVRSPGSTACAGGA